jgi:hypothetical protein
MGPIDPIRPVRLIRRERRKADDDEPAPPPAVNVTVNIGQPAPPQAAPYQPPTNLDAHLIAQGARTRGLRGGQKVLDTARNTYLATEHSGPNDRRACAGRIAKTEA